MPQEAASVVAATILQQLTRSERALGRLHAMIGAHSFTGSPNSVSFRFKARAVNGSNALHITLDPSDTYTVEFLSFRGTSRIVKKTYEDIYAEDLKRTFEAETGLYLSL